MALKSRSIPAAEAVSTRCRARLVEGAGLPAVRLQILFDLRSTPAGNIGPVGEALADALGVKGVVACPAFPAVGRTVYRVISSSLAGSSTSPGCSTIHSIQ